MNSTGRVDQFVRSVERRVDRQLERDPKGTRALFLAKWLGSRPRLQRPLMDVAERILVDISAEVTTLLSESEKQVPSIETMRLIHKIGCHRVMGSTERVGTAIGLHVDKKLDGHPFGQVYAQTLLPYGETFNEKLSRLAGWFFSKDQEAANALFSALDELADKENTSPERALRVKPPKVPINGSNPLIAIPSFRIN